MRCGGDIAAGGERIARRGRTPLQRSAPAGVSSAGTIALTVGAIVAVPPLSDAHAVDRPLMKIGRYRFAPPWWGLLLFAIAATLFSALGAWQIQRAHYKESLVAAQQAAREAGLTRMRPERAAADGDARVADLQYGRRYIAEGRYDGAHQILLRDQMHGQTVGYRVWTPLILDGGIRVMVDRGWVPDRERDTRPDPPAPVGPVRIQGFWRSFPQPPLQWGVQQACEARGWPRDLSYPGAATVRCQYEAPVVDGLLLLDPADPHGFVRDWDEDLVGLPPFGHYAYASQWFLAAVGAGVILVVVNLRRDGDA